MLVLLALARPVLRLRMESSVLGDADFLMRHLPPGTEALPFSWKVDVETPLLDSEELRARAAATAPVLALERGMVKDMVTVWDESVFPGGLPWKCWTLFRGDIDGGMVVTSGMTGRSRLLAIAVGLIVFCGVAFPVWMDRAAQRVLMPVAGEESLRSSGRNARVDALNEIVHQLP